MHNRLTNDHRSVLTHIFWWSEQASRKVQYLCLCFPLISMRLHGSNPHRWRWVVILSLIDTYLSDKLDGMQLYVIRRCCYIQFLWNVAVWWKIMQISSHQFSLYLPLLIIISASATHSMIVLCLLLWWGDAAFGHGRSSSIWIPQYNNQDHTRSYLPLCIQ